MALTAEQLKRAYQNNPDGTSHALAESLREFGYSSVTDDWVKEEVGRLINGGEPSGGPSVFLAGWLKDGID